MMFPNNDKISIYQLVNIQILAMVGVGILSLPRILSEEVGTDGWIVLLLAGVLAIILSYIYGYIIKSFPGRNWFDILSINLTKPIAYLVTLYFFIHFILIAGFITRVFIAVVKMMLLLRMTPRGVLLLSFLLVVGYMGRKGIETLGRLAEILVVPLGIIILIVFAISWTEVDFNNFLPIFQISFVDIIKGIPKILVSFLGMEVVLIFGEFTNKPEKSSKMFAIASTVVLILYLILNFSVLGLLGEQQIRYLVWPTITTLETVNLGGVFIENIAVVTMSLWVFIAFTTVAPIYLSGGIMLSNLLQTKEYNYLVLPLLPLLYIISRWSNSIADVYKNLHIINNYTSFGVLVIIPLIVLISMMIRKTHKAEE